MKPQVCNAGANCSNPNLILCKIAFVSLVTVDIVNSISRTVVNIIVLCKGPSGLVTKLNKKKTKKKTLACLPSYQLLGKLIWQQPCDLCFSKASTFSRRFRHYFLFGTLVFPRHTSSLRMPNWSLCLQKIISEPFSQKIYISTTLTTNTLFRLPTQNKATHSPVFQTNSITVILYTLSMLSLSKC